MPKKIEGTPPPERANIANLIESPLTRAEIEEFVCLVDGNPHPFEGRVLELKAKSGLSWRKITMQPFLKKKLPPEGT